MANFFISNAAARAALDAVVDLIDGGASAGTVIIYAGTEPADADASIGAATTLATITLADPAFGNSTDDTPGAIAAANSLPVSATASATGTASFFRVLDSDANVIMQGDVTATAGGGDMEINTVSVVSGATVRITAFNATMPES